MDKIDFSKSYGFITCDDDPIEFSDGVFAGKRHLETIVVPDTVTVIRTKAFSGCTGLKEIKLSENLTVIEDDAFRRCKKLKYIEIPNKVETIGSGAFYDCKSLSSITIGSAVTDFGECAFKGNTNVKDVKVNANNTLYDSRNNCNAIIETSSNTLVFGFNESTFPETVSGLSSHSMNGLTDLETITLPYTIVSLGSCVFSGCSNLTEIYVLSDNIASVETDSFSGLPQTGTLYCVENAFDENNVGLPEGWTIYHLDQFGVAYSTYDDEIVKLSNVGSWGEDVEIIFVTKPKETQNRSNRKIGYIYFNRAPKFIPNSTFNDSNVSWLRLPEGISGIGNYAFSESRLEEIEFPENTLTYIGNGAFNGCDSLISANIPNSVVYNTLDESSEIFVAGWFQGCDNLLSVSLGSGITKIPHKCFYDCHALSSVSFSNVNEIGYRVFERCYELSDIPSFTNQLTRIGRYAFMDCRKMTGIILPDSVNSIGESCFSNCSGVVTIHIGSGLSSITTGMFLYMSSLSSVTVSENNPYYDSRNNCNAIIETSSNKIVIGSNTTVIPSTVTAMHQHAFRRLTALTEVVIPEGFYEIPSFAFFECPLLSSVTLPRTLQVLYQNSFSYCISLSSIFLPNIQVIFPNPFVGDTSLTSVTIGSGCNFNNTLQQVPSLREVIFEEGRKYISNTAMLTGCPQITALTLPNSLEHITPYTLSLSTGITKLTIGEKLDTLDNIPTNSLQEIVFTGNRITIPDYMLQIYRYTAITIPSSVTSIGISAFAQSRLRVVYAYPINAPTIHSSTFFNTSENGTIYYPQNGNYSSWLNNTSQYYPGYYGWTGSPTL